MADLTPAEAIEALKRYPNQGDVEFARANDYSYGQPWADFFNRKAFNLLDEPNRDLNLGGPFNTRLVNPDQSKLPFGNVADVYAKAALASKRSALASLGFDPTTAAMDVTRDPEKVNILGSYNPDSDETYANARDPSTLVHESIHRGLEKLKDSPFWEKDFEGLGGENIVRWLMKNKMGDPESANAGPTGREQIDESVRLFDQGDKFIGSKIRSDRLAEMEAAAAKLLAAKTPRGPR